MGSQIICENNTIRALLVDCSPSQDSKAVIVIDQISEQILKTYLIDKENSQWLIRNHQQGIYNPQLILDEDTILMQYEWVKYPITWDTLDDLLNTFIELTNGFTYLFSFPKE